MVLEVTIVAICPSVRDGGRALTLSCLDREMFHLRLHLLLWLTQPNPPTTLTGEVISGCWSGDCVADAIGHFVALVLVLQCLELYAVMVHNT